MSMALEMRVKALEEALRGFDAKIADAIEKVRVLTATAEAVVEKVNARIDALDVTGAIDDRPPIEVPPFPKALRDIGLVPTEEAKAEIEAKITARSKA